MNQNTPNSIPSSISHDLYLRLQNAPVKNSHQRVSSSELDSRPHISSFERSSIIGFSTPLKNPISPFEIRFPLSFEKTNTQEKTEAQKSHSTILFENSRDFFELEEKGVLVLEVLKPKERQSPKVIDLFGFVSSRRLIESRSNFLKHNFGFVCKLCTGVFQTSAELRSHSKKDHKPNNEPESDKGLVFSRKKIHKTRNDFMKKFTEK